MSARRLRWLSAFVVGLLLGMAWATNVDAQNATPAPRAKRDTARRDTLPPNGVRLCREADCRRVLDSLQREQRTRDSLRAARVMPDTRQT